MLQNECCVYFIGDSYKHIKIGVANDIQRRINELSTAHAEPLYLWGSIVCFNQHCAYCLETYFHNLFNAHRLNGEWFNEEPIRVWLCLNMFSLNGMTTNDMKNIPVPADKLRFSKFAEIHLQKLLYYGRLPGFVENVQNNETTKEWSHRLRYSKYFIPASNHIKMQEDSKRCCEAVENVLLRKVGGLK